MGLVTAGLTAFYMFRLFYLTFKGNSRVEHDVEHHIHESPKSMTVPLMILAVLSVVGGWIGWPAALGGSNRFTRFLDPVTHESVGARVVERLVPASAGTEAVRRELEAKIKESEEKERAKEYGLMIASVLAALAGIWARRGGSTSRNRRYRKSLQRARRGSAGSSTTSITWTRFTTRCS